jgi:D-alanine--poly(phosphoribitol) ligase subunit 1
MSDIAERIEQAFLSFPYEPALSIGGTEFTFRDLYGRIEAIQLALETAVGSAEPLIGVLADDCVDTYAAVLAVLRSGRAFVPLNPEHPVGRNAAIVRQAGLRTLLAADDCSGDWPIPMRPIQTRGLLKADQTVPLRKAAAAAGAYLLFTSGSTGEPKGVPISRANLSAFLDALEAAGLAAGPGDRVLQMFDLTFDFSIASYLAPLARGACVCTVPRGSAKFAEVYRVMSEEKVTVAPLVPSVLAYLKPYFSDILLPELRLTVLCGEALLADIASSWIACAPAGRVANFYGPTEATVFATVYEWCPQLGRTKAFNGVVSIGKPLPSNLALIVDEALQPVAQGERGELCLGGPQVTQGYWNDPERNARSFFEAADSAGGQRYYRSGDVVMADSEGDLYFCGRIGQQVKVQGYRVELGEVEYHAREVARGHECVVVCSSSVPGTNELSLIVENYPDDVGPIVAALRQRLPAYMMPVRVVTMARLPMNDNGKIDRVALRQDIEARAR